MRAYVTGLAPLLCDTSLLGTWASPKTTPDAISDTWKRRCGRASSCGHGIGLSDMRRADRIAGEMGTDVDCSASNRHVSRSALEVKCT